MHLILINGYNEDMKYQIVPDSQAMIALTYECTCNCPHCSAALYGNPNSKILSSTEIYDIIDQLKELGLKTVYFFGGEPLLDKRIFEYVHYVKKTGMESRLDTNGTLLNLKIIEALKAAGLNSLGVSLDSPLEDIHDQARGVDGLFRKNLKSIIFCKKKQLQIYISTIATKENVNNGELFLMTKLADKMDVPLRILSAIQCGRWKDNEQIKLSRQDIELLKKYLKKDKVYWERTDQDHYDCSFQCSSLGRSNIYISAYGEVQPCCFIPLSFGNLRQEKLASILEKMWDSKLYSNNEYLDCPVNSALFRSPYKLDLVSEYPYKFNG